MEIVENEKMSMQAKEPSFENFEKNLTGELNRVNDFYNEISENLYKVIEEEQKQKTYSHHYNRLDEILSWWWIAKEKSKINKDIIIKKYLTK